jgi:transposase
MDARHLARKTLEDLRKLAVQRVLDGTSPELVTRVFGFSSPCIYRWLNIYKAQGMEGLNSHPAPGKLPKLNADHRAWLLSTLLEKTPLDFGFQTMLWTQALVKAVIEKEQDLALHRSTVGRSLEAMGLTPQVPLRRASERNAKAIEKWKSEEFPRLRKRVKKERASLYFLDEMGLRSTESQGRTYGLRGQRPVVTTTGRNFGVNVISAVSLSGDLRFMIMEKNFNSEVFLTFLERLMSATPRKLYLVADHHSAHQSKVVQGFLKTHQAKMELVFLPTYAPDTNPDEWIWQEAKREVRKKPLVDKPDLRKKVINAMHAIARAKDRIRKIFEAPDLDYIFSTA